MTPRPPRSTPTAAPPVSSPSPGRRPSRPTGSVPSSSKPATPVPPVVAGLLCLGVVGTVLTDVTATTGHDGTRFPTVLPTTTVLLLIVCGYLVHRPYADAAAGIGRSPDTLTWLRTRAVRTLPLWWTVLSTSMLHFGTPPSFGPIDLLLTGLLLHAPVAGLRSAVVDPGWILSTIWILGLVLPPWNGLVRRIRRRMRRRPPPSESQLVGLIVLATPALAVPMLRIFVPVLLGAMISVLRHGREPSAPKRILDVLGTLSVAAATTVVAIALLVLADRHRIGSTAEAIIDDPVSGLLWAIAALPWVLLVVRPGLEARSPRPPRTAPITAMAALALGTLLWHDPVLDLLVEGTGPDIGLPSAVFLSLLGGILAAFASRVLIENPIRRLLLRTPEETRPVPSEWEPTGIARVDRPRPPRNVGPRLRTLDLLRILSVVALIVHDVARIADPPRQPPEALGALAILAAAVVITSSAFRLHQALLHRTPTTGGAETDGTNPPSDRARARGRTPGLLTVRRISGILGLHWAVLTVAFLRGDLDHVRGLGAHLQLVLASPLPDPSVLQTGSLGVTSMVLVAELWSTVLVGIGARSSASLRGRGLGFGSALVIPPVLFVMVAAADRSGDRVFLTIALWAAIGVVISSLDVLRRAGRRPPPLLRRIPAATIVLLPLAGALLIGSRPQPSASPIALGRMPVATLTASAITALLLLVVLLDPPRFLRRSIRPSKRRVLGTLVLGILAWYPTLLRILHRSIESAPLPFTIVVVSAAAAIAFVGERAAGTIADASPTAYERSPR